MKTILVIVKVDTLFNNYFPSLKHFVHFVHIYLPNFPLWWFCQCLCCSCVWPANSACICKPSTRFKQRAKWRVLWAKTQYSICTLCCPGEALTAEPRRGTLCPPCARRVPAVCHAWLLLALAPPGQPRGPCRVCGARLRMTVTQPWVRQSTVIGCLQVTFWQ